MSTIGSKDRILAFEPTMLPVAQVAPGEIFTVETLDCFSESIQDESTLFSSVGWECVNPATGPIEIRGAKPGDTLKVEILDIAVGDMATMTTHPDYGALPGSVEERTRKVPVIDGKVHFGDSLSWPVDPMIGVIGTAPKEGSIATGVPDTHGGNMDTKHIRAGATLYLPVEVEGALLCLGDLHALMGDGEVAVCGAEISGKVTLRTDVIEGRPLPLPSLVSGDAFYSICSRESLDDAVQEAVRMMRGFVAEKSCLDPTDALMLLSLVGDTQISQIVDPQKTARCHLPLAVLDAYGISLP